MVLRGGCVPLGEEGVPFAPVTEALRGLARALDPDELEAVAGPARAELARLVPDLAWGDGEAVRPAVGGAGQGRLFELLLGMVERLAERGLLLIMEGLRWADRSTRDLVAFLATYLRDGPVLVLLTSAATSCTGCTRCGAARRAGPQPPRATAGGSPAARAPRASWPA